MEVFVSLALCFLLIDDVLFSDLWNLSNVYVLNHERVDFMVDFCLPKQLKSWREKLREIRNACFGENTRNPA